MTFLQELAKNANRTTTENGGATNASSLSACLDFFALGAAKRNDTEGLIKLFEKALKEDKQKAVRILFYIRDIRGGQGERSIFRNCLRVLYKNSPDTFNQIVALIPEYGRWDDLIEFVDSETVKVQVKDQWRLDLEAEHPSLLAKWLPSHNAHNSKTIELGKKWAKILCGEGNQGMHDYRQALSYLRNKIGILETDMSQKRWKEINYEVLPAQALRKHSQAFRKHDSVRFQAYLDGVKRGTKKVNTSTLYTYEVYDTLSTDPELADTLWKNLPEYTNENALVVADVSGSMMGRPMSISVSLALYFAEHSKGPFANKFMTFSRFPRLVEVMGNSLYEKMNNIERADWDGNTNVEAVFDTILKAAVAANAKQNDLPQSVYIISDMEFDSCVNADKTVFEEATRKFQEAGYKLPTIVFWNVNSRNNAVPVTKYDGNVVLVSGSSQSTFATAVQGKNPIELMDEVINSERYAQIKIAD